ncbi:MAG: UDP-glucose 4-epimerase GalE [Bryobacteraceae bacterium]
MAIVVVGGAGYIGSHTARALRRHGHEVVIFDNLSTGSRLLADGFELIVGDIADEDKVSKVMRRADAVMHFAAHAYVGESVENPRKYFQNNVKAGLTLLNTTLDAGVRNFVFSSTCAVYGAPPTIPIAENTPRQPVNPYGATKLFFENALEAYARAYGLSYAALRYFNAAGADESGEIGELHDPETHLIPLALAAASETGPELQVFGIDHPTPDGTCIRDYVHVNDIAEAHVLALRHLMMGGQSVTLNLGTGEGFSVKQVLACVHRVTGKEVRWRQAPRRDGDPPSLVADSSRAYQVLRWRPQRALEEIVSTAWDWIELGRARWSRPS